MKSFSPFPYECTITRKIDLLKAKASDFPIKTGDDYLRDKDGNIMYDKPDYIVPSSSSDERFVNISILKSECDVTNAGASNSNKLLGSNNVVSIPFLNPIPILRGDMIETSVYGFKINGTILDLFPSRFGISIYLADDDN